MSVPDKLVIRTGGSNWRTYVPFLVADTTTNFQYWNPDAQYNNVDVAPHNEIAKQFSYFAAYWLNRNKVAVNGTLNVSVSSGGTFYFKALNSNPVTSYQGLYAPVNGSYVTLTLQQDGVDAGISSNITLNSTVGSTLTLQFGMYSLNLSNFPVGRGIKFQLYGAGGGNTQGGSGGFVEGVFTVSNDSPAALCVVVGTAGGTVAHYSENSGVTGGYLTPGGTNGGGRGVDNSASASASGGGGGAVDVRLEFSNDYSKRILVAGGGGGGTNNSQSDTYGGNAGYPSAPNVANGGNGGADGGTQSSGGSLGGGFGFGGENKNNTGWNGGGGSGYYGGGACKVQHGAGAGGSGYYNSSYITAFVYTASGGGSAAQTNGRAVLTVVQLQTPATLSASPNIFYRKFVSGASISFDVITSNAGAVARTHESSNSSIFSIPTASVPSGNIVAPGKITINVIQPATTNYTAITTNQLITIIIVGSGITYSSETFPASFDLTGLNLSSSVFSNCNLTSANLTNANLTNSTFSNSTILTSANLFGATVNASTNLTTATLTNIQSGRIIGKTSLLPPNFTMI